MNPFAGEPHEFFNDWHSESISSLMIFLAENWYGLVVCGRDELAGPHETWGFATLTAGSCALAASDDAPLIAVVSFVFNRVDYPIRQPSDIGGYNCV